MNYSGGDNDSLKPVQQAHISAPNVQVVSRSIGLREDFRTDSKPVESNYKHQMEILSNDFKEDDINNYQKAVASTRLG